jgi:hypothetical protein
MECVVVMARLFRLIVGLPHALKYKGLYIFLHLHPCFLYQVILILNKNTYKTESCKIDELAREILGEKAN